MIKQNEQTTRKSSLGKQNLKNIWVKLERLVLKTYVSWQVCYVSEICIKKQTAQAHEGPWQKSGVLFVLLIEQFNMRGLVHFWSF